MPRIANRRLDRNGAGVGRTSICPVWLPMVATAMDPGGVTGSSFPQRWGGLSDLPGITRYRSRPSPRQRISSGRLLPQNSVYHFFPLNLIAEKAPNPTYTFICAKDFVRQRHRRAREQEDLLEVKSCGPSATTSANYWDFNTTRKS